jgi:CheY-like chemotaxis protein
MPLEPVTATSADGIPARRGSVSGVASPPAAFEAVRAERLPTAGEDGGEAAVASIESGRVAGTSELRGRQRVLVVEDNPDALEAMRIILGSWGYEVATSDNVPLALEVMRSYAPDVIISDLAMPNVDGFALARAVRELTTQLGRGERLALIAITGFASSVDRGRALAAGFDAYLTKPIDFENLKALLDRLAPLLAEPLQA